MAKELTLSDVGARIVSLRKNKGYSQEDLAKLIHISRPSLAQIELGKRGIDILEILKLSHVLGFSIDSLLSNNFNATANDFNLILSEPEVRYHRVSEPTLNIDKLQQVLLYLLEHCAGKPNVGETVLNKLLYFIDFNYYELYEEHLTGESYRKLPFGPVSINLESLLKQMLDQEMIQRIKTDYHGYPQTRYLPLVKANLLRLKASETEVINNVIDNMSNWSANTISNYSHKDIPWVTSKDGEIINYELVFYREAPFSVRTYEEDEN